MSNRTINLVSSDGEPSQETQGHQSDMILNLVSSEDGAPSKSSGNGNDKHKRFLQKRRFLERKGYLKDKQNKYNHKKGQSIPGHNKKQHNRGQPSWKNGVKQHSLPTTTHKTSLPHTHKLDSVMSSGSKPAASTNSTASLTVTVRNTNNHEQSKKTVHYNSTTDAQAPRTKTYTASLPSGSTPFGNPTKYLAIDCEMVGTGPKGSISQLARCSIVSYDGDVVYDKFIKPPVPVTDYRTRWSGIRWNDLVRATPFTDARKEILRLLTGKVVVGHAVHHDFKVLGYSHPAALTRDTSLIPLLNRKAGFGEFECISLKKLTKAIFNRDIQTGNKGHSSVEDAQATMELYKVVEVEWERALANLLS